MRAELARMRAGFVLGVLLAAPAFGAAPQDPSAGTPSQEAFPAASPESQGVDPRALERLAAEVRADCESGRVVGAELLVIQNRRTVFHEGFGWKDREDEVPMQPDTLFNIRSMTKTLVGAAVQMLVDAGDLELDDPVARYLPDFDNERSAGITVRHLLTHRSGLPLTMFTARLDEYEDLQALAAAAGDRGPDFPPGTRFWYSDAGTDVLGALVEEVAGMGLEEFLRERVLDPLGMTDSLTARQSDDPRWSRIASLYFGQGTSWTRLWAPGEEPFYPFQWGSQGVYSTPRDYARFLAMWMDGGKVAGEQLLSKEAVARTLTPESRMSMLGSDAPMPTCFPGMRVWYGQMAVLYVPEGAPEGSPARLFGHSGSDGTIAWVWPDRDLMVLYFTQTRGSPAPLRLEAAVDRSLIRGQLDEEPVPDEFQPYVGTYVANFGPFQDEEFRIFVWDGRLALDIPSQLLFALEGPDEDGEWRSPVTEQIVLSFERDEAGAVTGMRMGEALAPRGRAPPPVTLDPASLERYLGVYRDEENGMDVEIVIDGGELAVQVPGAPAPYRFAPPDADGWWSLRINPSVQVHFEEDADGRVVAYTVRSPEGGGRLPRVGDLPEE